jgi:uncharacterized protein (TIGR02466 family)
MNNIQVKTMDLFPTRIWSTQLDHLAPHYESWRKIIHDMRASEMKPRGKSNRGGWNSPDILGSNPDFKPLMEVAGQLMVNILKPMTDKPGDRQLAAWANMHDEGGFNTQHCHPGSSLSACFYLSVPKGSGDLILIDPRPGANLSTFTGKAPNCRSVNRITPQEGLLVVFPSWLEHRVEAHENTEPRLSIAMNLS